MGFRVMLSRLCLLCVAGVPALALPCSGQACTTRFQSIPAPGRTLPANAPAAGVRAALFGESNWDGGTTSLISQLTSLSIKFADGGAVSTLPVVAGDAVLFAPPRGFVAGGAYTLSWSGPCPGDAGFTVGPAAALPATSATVSVDHFLLKPGYPSPSYCGGPVGPVQYAFLKIATTAQIEPWLAVTRWELEVDGQNWSTADYGRFGPEPFVWSAPPPGGMLPVDSFYIRCGNWDGGSNTGLGPGAHQARLLGRIAGLDAPIPTNTVTALFDCVTGAPDAGLPAEPDGGVVAADAGIVDAGTGGSGADGGTNPSTHSGCSAGGAGGPLAILVSLLFAIASRISRSPD